MNPKKSLRKCLALGAAPLMCAMVLAACGDDSASVKEKDSSATVVEEVETRGELLNCNPEREGELYYVAEEDADYLCESGMWKKLNADSSSSEKNAESSSSEESSSSIVSSSSSSSAKSSSSSVVSSSSARSSSSSMASSSSEKSSSSVKESSDMDDSSVYDASAKTLTDNRDGQTYKTVTIGTQTWMAENLNYRYVGVAYKYSSFTDDSTSWCYEGKASNCETYGRLYTWAAAMDSAGLVSASNRTGCGYGVTCTPNRPHRGICPEGWHLPTDEEYSTLYTAIGGTGSAGTYLKSTSGWYNSGNGNDKYGFSVLPAGYRGHGGYFDYQGRNAYLWSASEYNSYEAWFQYFYYNREYVYQYYSYKYDGFSVRCLKD